MITVLISTISLKIASSCVEVFHYLFLMNDLFWEDLEIFRPRSPFFLVLVLRVWMVQPLCRHCDSQRSRPGACVQFIRSNTSSDFFSLFPFFSLLVSCHVTSPLGWRHRGVWSLECSFARLTLSPPQPPQRPYIPSQRQLWKGNVWLTAT